MQHRLIPNWYDTALMEWSSHWVELLGHHVHYLDEGDGPLLLCQHGGLGWSYSFNRLISHLREHFRIIVPDMPGYGLSWIGADGFSAELVNCANVLDELITVLRLEEITLMGINLGGPIAIGAAAQRPERIRGLALSGSVLWPVEDNPGVLRAITDSHMRVLPRLTQDRAMVTEFMSRTFPDIPERDQLITHLTAPFTDSRRRTAAAQMISSVLDDEFFLTDVKRGLRALADKPCAYLAGHNDPVYSADTINRLNEQFVSFRKFELEHPASYICLTQPEDVARLLISWYNTEVSTGTG